MQMLSGRAGLHGMRVEAQLFSDAEGGKIALHLVFMRVYQ
jgi:hypothetical protein